MKKIVLGLLMATVFLTSITSCEKDENDNYEYTCIQAQKAADVYKSTVQTNLSALRAGIISAEQASESNERAKKRALSIINNADCYVSLN